MKRPRFKKSNCLLCPVNGYIKVGNERVPVPITSVRAGRYLIDTHLSDALVDEGSKLELLQQMFEAGIPEEAEADFKIIDEFWHKFKKQEVIDMIT